MARRAAASRWATGSSILPRWPTPAALTGRGAGGSASGVRARRWRRCSRSRRPRCRALRAALSDLFRERRRSATAHGSKPVLVRDGRGEAAAAAAAARLHRLLQLDPTISGGWRRLGGGLPPLSASHIPSPIMAAPARSPRAARRSSGPMGQFEAPPRQRPGPLRPRADARFRAGIRRLAARRQSAGRADLGRAGRSG